MKKSVFLVSMLTAIVSSAFTVFASEYIFGDPFPDVEEGSYYEDSVYKMRNRGVISGYENGDFGPNDSVTRAQMATILDRYDQNLTGTFVAAGENKGVDDLIYIVCAALSEDDMDNNPYLSNNFEFNKEIYKDVCLIQ